MNKLQKFISEMPYGKTNEFRNKVLNECGISSQLYRLWRNGLNVAEKYHKTIDSIALEMFKKTVFGTEGGEE